MKRSKKRLGVFLPSLALLVASACGPSGKKLPTPPQSDATEITYSEYDLLKLGNIGLAPVGVYSSLYMDDEHFAQIKNANFNLVNTSSAQTNSRETIEKVLELCENQGLKALIEDPAIKSAIGDIRGGDLYNEKGMREMCRQAIASVENYYDYPAYAGSVLCDEPFATAFPKLSRLADTLSGEFGKTYGVNMFPIGGNGYGVDSDREYIESWVRPKAEGGYGQPFYSYDKYCFLNNNREAGDYFFNLDLVRSVTNLYDVPFWSYVLTTEHLSYRYPTENDLRWNLFTSLCFGSKVVKYYLFNSLNNNSAGLTGLIDEEGNPTEKLAWVGKANGEVLSIGDKLVESRCEGMMLAGTVACQTRGLYEKALTSYDAVESLSVAGGAAVAGCFENPATGEKSVMIVGETPRTNCTLTLRFREGARPFYEVSLNGEPKTLSVVDKEAEILLPAGSYLFIPLS